MSAPRRFTAAEQAAAEAWERGQARHYSNVDKYGNQYEVAPRRRRSRRRRASSARGAATQRTAYCSKCRGPHVYKHGRP